MSLLKKRLGNPQVELICSDLCRFECRVKPLRENKTILLTAFDQFFTTMIGETISLSRLVMDRATELSARYGFKTADAIHLAAAIEGGCDILLTNDRRLVKCTEITVELICQVLK